MRGRVRKRTERGEREKQWGNKDRETSNKQTMVVKECYSYKRMSEMSIWEQGSGPERGTQR